jgi:Tol biopolymer transport system component
MRRRARLVVAVGLAATVGPLTLAFPAQAAFPGKNGRIAFTVQPRERGDALSSTIETIVPSGRGRRVLGACPTADCFQTIPAWSPDGRRLAFGLRDAGLSTDPGLAIVRANGAGLRQLPSLTGPYGAPAWAPSGRRLLFPGEGGLFTARTDGTGLRRVTSMPTVFESAWSRRGVIAFAHDDDPFQATMPDDGIYTVRSDGSRLRRLVRDRYNASAPASPDWSPYGSKLAFSFADSVDPEIHVADAMSGAHRRLTTRGGSEPAWSPDGRFIAFIRSGDLYVMRSDGSRERRILDDGLTESGVEIYLSSPSWQPLPR